MPVLRHWEAAVGDGRRDAATGAGLRLCAGDRAGILPAADFLKELMMGKTQTNTPEYLLARLERLRAAMAKAKVSSLLVNNFPDVSYLTGFEGDDSWAVVTPKNIWLITDSRYEEQSARECPWVRTVVRRQGLALEVARIAKREKIEKLGIQQEILTLRQMEILQKELKKVGRVKLAPVVEMVLALRAVKDAREVSLIERAAVIAEEAFLTVKASLRVGMTENEIAAALTYEMRKRGAQDSSFDAIVGINANASLPHYRPGDVRLEKDS
ncbi:MAG: aminopeptidase P family protein, partial [Phycisphaerales bacterium]|nr:aminopeptidase P family protein [Phycisphaerales bacterium]